MTTFTALRPWRTRTALKGIREHWPLKWWVRFARQFWREWRWPVCRIERALFNTDLRVRRDERVYGRGGAIKALARRHNAGLQRSVMNLEAMRRRLMAEMSA